MGELEEQATRPPAPETSSDGAPPQLEPPDDALPPPPPPPRFDPSRSNFLLYLSHPLASNVIGIIRRKALIKDLAAVYHAECLAYCQELLELQRKWEETYTNIKTPDDARKETTRPTKRSKKSR
ncbi:uncharacterized protein LOC127795199 isoform X1 [Diospyros lotus]|uniref:uncharacterized protein LOC127795199 isoform X1 n=1 Tax=Diospyros lotus TaxID=55363 RepID=UPI00225A2C2D|nr:uncharacterized protein LOC127795199 isoform X1 [Diospyros lotus]